MDPPALPADPARLRRRLLLWYDANRRDLPWRAPPGGRADPYAVLVSEVMLQQTTVATVRPRFLAFVRRFPTLEALADAPLDDVLHEWQGLGYYRRARALHGLARTVRDGGGALPATVAGLEALPGVGPYTAAAIAAMAFGVPTVPVDGNVARVLARLARVETPLPAAWPVLRRLAADLAGAGAGEGAGDGRWGDLAQAAIELGALVCRPAPACGGCPWREVCEARAAGVEAALPRKAARAAKPRRYAVAFLVRRDDGALLLRRRPETGLLAGLVELPTTPWQEGPFRDEGAILAGAPEALDLRPLPGEVRHGFTHLDLTLGLWTGAGHEAGDGFFWRQDRLGELALPTLTRKLLRLGGITPGARP